MAPERLQKVIAASGVASRRQAEVLIANGRVTVDGKVASIGAQVDGAKAIIAVDGRVIGATTQKTYLLLHKPAGVTSTVRDRHAVADGPGLPARRRSCPEGARLYPVGRLDQDSEGLLILTNDGEWSERVLHPRFGVEREYAIGLRGRLDGEQVEALKAGIAVDEGLATLGGLRSMTGTEVERLAELLRSAGRPLTLVSRHARPGLEAPASSHVRGGRRTDRAARPGADRPGPHRRPGHRPGPAPEGARSPRPGFGRWVVASPPEAAGMTRKLVVALDGPGSSGKSSVGAAAALACGYRFCDTGLLYRAVTWLALARDLSASYPHAVRGLVDEVELAPDADGRLARVVVDGTDHTDDVRGPEVDAAVSSISAIPELRLALLTRQRDLAAPGGIVMAGRDIGTVVLPDADLKLFLDASVEERARRRTEERDLDPGQRRGRWRSSTRSGVATNSTRPAPSRRSARPGRPDHLDGRQRVRGHGRCRRRRDPRRRGPGMSAETDGQAPGPTSEPLEHSITPLIWATALSRPHLRPRDDPGLDHGAIDASRPTGRSSSPPITPRTWTCRSSGRG